MNAYKQEKGTAGEITLTPKEVRHAIRLLELLTTLEGRQDPEAPASSGGANDATSGDESLRAVARLSYAVRQSRTEHFSPAMFGEPAWDILLALYLKEAGGALPTVSSLARDASIPVTTAFRWLDYLEEKRLIERHRSSDDARALTVALSDEGRGRLERYFADVVVSVAATRAEIAGDA